jgi:hypothetical protein
MDQVKRYRIEGDVVLRMTKQAAGQSYKYAWVVRLTKEVMARCVQLM